MLPSSLIIQPQQQSQHLAHSRKQKNAKPFTWKVGQRQDVTKASDSFPSKSDGEIPLHVLEFSHSSSIFSIIKS